MFKGVIFDIDGTLYDYQINDFHAMNHFCAFVEKNLGVEEKIFRKTYSEARNIIHMRPYEFAEEFLSKLKDSGVKISTCTG